MVRRNLLILLVSAGAWISGPLGAQQRDPGFGDLAHRETRSSNAATEVLTPAVWAYYAGKFDYGLALGVRGTPAALKKVKSVTYAIGAGYQGLSVPYGQSSSLATLAKAHNFCVTEAKERGTPSSGAGFWAQLAHVPRENTLYIEAKNADGTTELVGGNQWTLEMPTLVMRPPGFSLEVSPSYVKDASTSTKLGRAFGAFVSQKEPLQVLRKLKLKVVSDPKAEGVDLALVLKDVEGVEYTLSHTMTSVAYNDIQIVNATLDKDGAFSIDVPDNPDTRRFSTLQTYWTVNVAVSFKGGRVWTFWTRKTASITEADKTDKVRPANVSAYGTDLAGRAFLDLDSVFKNQR